MNRTHADHRGGGGGCWVCLLGGRLTLLLLGCLAGSVISSCSRKSSTSSEEATFNRPPTAIISVLGEPQLGEQLTFDGSGSSDPDGDDLFDDWALVLKPGRSALTSSDLEGAGPLSRSFIPDVTGAYRVELTISDGEFLAFASIGVLVTDGSSGGGPVVELICPSRGGLEGGTHVSIVGGVFPEGTLVRFGNVLSPEVEVVEEGSELRILTPPAEVPGVVDLALEFDDQALIIPEGFTYLPDPLPAESENGEREPFDLPLERKAYSLAALGDGRILLGQRDGRVQLVDFGADGIPVVGDDARFIHWGRFMRLSPSPVFPDGRVEVGGTLDHGSKVFIITVTANGELSAVALDFHGEAIDILLTDFDGQGDIEVLVADRRNRRVVVYERDGEGFSVTGEFPTGGAPSVLVAAQLDEDSGSEVVVGSLPGPDITLIDPGSDGVQVTDQEVPEIDGIVLLASGDILGRGRDDIAAITTEKNTENHKHGQRAMHVFSTEDSLDGEGPFFAIDRENRVELDAGGDWWFLRWWAGWTYGIQAVDLDLDQDLDLLVFDGSSGDVIVLENTLFDGPETPEECDSILETGERPESFGLRETRIPMYSDRGIRALLGTDVDSDPLPELIGSHSKELVGLRVLKLFE